MQKNNAFNQTASRPPPDCPLNNKLAVKSVYLTHKTVLDRLTVSFILQEIQIQHHQARRDETRPQEREEIST